MEVVESDVAALRRPIPAAISFPRRGSRPGVKLREKAHLLHTRAPSKKRVPPPPVETFSLVDDLARRGG